MKIAFLGDSLTHGNNWQSAISEHIVRNFGVKGDKTSDALLRLNQIHEFEPDVVFIMLGINDLGEAIRFDEIVKNYEQIVLILKEQNPSVQIFIQSLLPINKTIFKNEKLQIADILNFNISLIQFAAKLKCGYLSLYEHFVDKNNYLKKDFTNDGLHLNTKAYSIWEHIIKYKNSIKLI